MLEQTKGKQQWSVKSGKCLCLKCVQGLEKQWSEGGLTKWRNKLIENESFITTTDTNKYSAGEL